MTAAQTVAAWLVAALAHFAPAPGPAHDAVVAEQARVADALVAVAYDAGEPPLYRGRDGRARTALLLASIAAHESGTLPRLAAGECRPWECDHGQAMGLMQLHLGAHGVELLPGAGFRYCAADGPECLTAERLAGDEAAQVRVALHWLRLGGIGRYTGEGDASAPAARRRLVAADVWAAKHPPPALDEAIRESDAATVGARVAKADP